MFGSLPAKPVVVFKPESTHFGDYSRREITHFIIGFTGIWHKREICSKVSENIRALPNASARIRDVYTLVRNILYHDEQTGPDVLPSRVRCTAGDYVCGRNQSCAVISFMSIRTRAYNHNVPPDAPPLGALGSTSGKILRPPRAAAAAQQRPRSAARGAPSPGSTRRLRP